MPVEPPAPRRAVCASHDLALSDEGDCLICRRGREASERARTGGLRWRSLLVLGCVVSGLIGWQLAKSEPALIALRPEYRLAVLALEARVPVTSLEQQIVQERRGRAIRRPPPIAARARRPRPAVELEVEVASPADPAPGLVGAPAEPTEATLPARIHVVFEAPEAQPWRPVAVPPPRPSAGGRVPATVVPRRPGGGEPRLTWRPPGGLFPGGGTGELWRADGASRARAARARSAARGASPQPSRRRLGGRSTVRRASRAMASRPSAVGSRSRRARVR